MSHRVLERTPPRGRRLEGEQPGVGRMWGEGVLVAALTVGAGVTAAQTQQWRDQNEPVQCDKRQGRKRPALTS